jgi:hypothetical protein
MSPRELVGGRRSQTTSCLPAQHSEQADVRQQVERQHRRHAHCKLDAVDEPVEKRGRRRITGNCHEGRFGHISAVSLQLITDPQHRAGKCPPAQTVWKRAGPRSPRRSS